MSTIDGLEAKLLIDKRLDFEEVPRYIIEKGGDQISYFQDISTSYADSFISFSTVPPSAFKIFVLPL